MSLTTQPLVEELLSLAPKTLPNLRRRRYHGDDLCLPVSAFAAPDQAYLRKLYHLLQDLLIRVGPNSGRKPGRFEELLSAADYETLLDCSHYFGRASCQDNATPMMAKTVHDLRGGGLTSLVGLVQLVNLRGELEAEDLNPLYFLTRDHLKIMRNALLGLDDAKREEDLKPKLHGTDFIVQKWSGATLHGQERDLRLEVECPQPTAISECCVEFGALDRILYNMINNACRHAVGDQIHLWMLPIPDREGMDLRFVLMNQVSAGDFAHLQGMGDLGELFREGASTTGSGYGLAIANDFVTHAYGLRDGQQAVQGGYLGACLLEGNFAVWFHWPRIVED